jgi:TolA-binding protein
MMRLRALPERARPRAAPAALWETLAAPAALREMLAAPAALCAALALALALASCAKTSDVERVEQANRVQDERLRALEEGLSDALRQQFAKLTADMTELKRVVEGRTTALQDRLDQLVAEQTKISETVDRNQAQQKRGERRLEEQVKAFAAYRTDAENDLDKLRLRMKDLEGLLKSPIAGLPAATEPDKVFRDAFFLLISGQLDLAIDRFGQFMQQFPKEPRRAEALFRQGQAYFLLRKYDYVLVPLFELLDKHAQSKFVIEARWLLARSLEETGDFKLARDFYAQLINGKTVYSADASRRVAFMNKLLPATAETPKPDTPKPETPKPAPPSNGAAKPDKPEKSDTPAKPEAGGKS